MKTSEWLLFELCHGYLVINLRIFTYPSDESPLANLNLLTSISLVRAAWSHRRCGTRLVMEMVTTRAVDKRIGRSEEGKDKHPDNGKNPKPEKILEGDKDNA
jgi:hypothetical protein